MAIRDGLYRVINDGQRSQPKEIKLHETNLLNINHVELGHKVAAGFIAVDGAVVRDLRGGNHDAPGMFAHVTCQTFQFEGHLHDFIGILIRIDELLEPWLFLQCFGQCHAGFKRDHFR